MAHYWKPLGSVPIIFGGAKERAISVPKCLQTNKGGYKNTPDQDKTKQQGQKCRSSNKHEKLSPQSHPLLTTLPSSWHRAASHVGAFPTHSPPTPPSPEEEVQRRFGRGEQIKPCQKRSENLSSSSRPPLPRRALVHARQGAAALHHPTC